MREIDAIYREILEIARQRVKEAWYKADRRREQVESQHAQLIPALLHCDDVRRHRHYLDVECRRFARECRRQPPLAFEPLWWELEATVAHEFVRVIVARAVSPMPLDYRSPATRRGSG